MRIIICVIAACLWGYGPAVESSNQGSCPPTPSHGHFEFLGPDKDLDHYRLKCDNGYHVYPQRGDTLLTCKGSPSQTIKTTAAICSQRAITCLPTEFKCTTNLQCVPKKFLCDGNNNCEDGSDEADAVCGSDSRLACKPQSNWMHGSRTFTFYRSPFCGLGADVSSARSSVPVVTYLVGCIDGYEPVGYDLLRCRRGRLLNAPPVLCKEIGYTTCAVESDYKILDYHNAKLDMDVDNYDEQAPGTVTTVQCRNGGPVATAYCAANGTFIGLPDCSVRG